MIEEILTDAFASELEKFGFDPLAALAALGAVGGGIYGAADATRFDPGWIDKSLKGGAGLRGRLASGVLGAATMGSVASIPSVLGAPFKDDEEDLVTTAGVGLAAHRGGRTAAKSSKIRELFQPRAAAVKAFRENMKP